MLDKKASQEQTQNVNIAQQEHGLVEQIICAHHGQTLVRQAVNIMIFHGQVTRVFCEYYHNKLCTSPFHKGPIKICNIKTEL